MKRPRSQPTFTLFPFLAVLMCTMGALILILLVTTRRIRKQAVERQQSVVMASLPQPIPLVSVFEPTAVLAPVPEMPLSRLRPVAIPEPDPTPTLPLGPTPQELARQRYLNELAERQQEQARLDALGQRQLQDLRQQREQLERAVQESLAAVKRLRASQQAVKVQQDKLGALQAEIIGKQSQTESQRQQLVNELNAAQQELTDLKQQQLQAEQLVQDRRPRLSISARDSQSGTDRRPILIECRASGLSFASEQVHVSATDLNGFLPEYNPIRSGTEALIAYWSELDRAAGRPVREPYVLLVVRPSGIEGYYVAQKMLGQLKTQNGYELILDQDEMAWPETDAQAADRCRNAVQEALANRAKADAATPGGSQRRRPDDMVFSDANGAFRLREIEEARNIQDSADYLNRGWVSPHGRRTSTPQAEFGRLQPDSENNNVSERRNAFGAPEKQDDGPNPFAARARELEQQRAALSSEMNRSTSRTIVPPAVDEDWSTSDAARQSSADTAGSLSSDLASPRLQSPRSGSTESPRAEAPPTPFPEFGSGQGRDVTAGASTSPQLPVVPARAIGVEREIALHVWADGVASAEAADGTAKIAIAPGVSIQSQQQQLARLVESEIQSWGPAPASFAWRPSIKLLIHPGGNLHVGRVKELMQTWGLKIQTEYVFESIP